MSKRKILVVGHGSAKIMESLEFTAKQNNMELESISDMIERCEPSTAKLFQDYGHFTPMDISIKPIEKVPFYFNVPKKKRWKR